MKKGLTELVFILDARFMGGLESDTIGGYTNANVVVDGECYITTVLFDNNYELLHDRIDIKAVSAITDVAIRWRIAHFDAIGKTIHKIGKRKSTPPRITAPIR